MLNNHFEQATERVNCRLGSHRNKIVGERSLVDMPHSSVWDALMGQLAMVQSYSPSMLGYFSPTLKNFMALSEFQENRLTSISEQLGVGC